MQAILVLLFSLIFPFQLFADNQVPHNLQRCSVEHQDKDIQIQAQMLFELNPVLKFYSIHAKALNRQVTLYGEVRTQSEKELAQDLTAMVEYVAKVNNQIRINPQAGKKAKQSAWSQKIIDATISSKIKTKLFTHAKTHALAIHVRTLNSIVWLNGTVNDVEEKKLATDLALQTKGVLAVKNKLKIN